MNEELAMFELIALCAKWCFAGLTLGIMSGMVLAYIFTRLR